MATVTEQLKFVTQMDESPLDYRDAGSLCEGNDCLLGKQHLYMALGTVNICTVKARELSPPSCCLCSRHLSTGENRTIKSQRIRGSSFLSLCLRVSFGNCVRSACFLPQLAREVSSRRRPSVFSEAACLFFGPSRPFTQM